MPVNHEEMVEYYKSVYPAQEMTAWLSYGGDGYFARREWCFTMIGDIFTRYRSYLTEHELRSALCRDAPEKIDIGAVYNVRANLKGQVALFPVERELVFDIDMSDYDSVRSCCSGKKICSSCWGWMASAARVLDFVLRDDFGFVHILPVFSGRRGLHVWVCDKRARTLADEERNSIAHYVSVLDKDANLAIVFDIFNDALHPTLAEIDRQFLLPTFDRLFLNPDSPNFVGLHGPAKVILETLNTILAHSAVKGGRYEPPQEGQGLDWGALVKGLPDMLPKFSRYTPEKLLACLRFSLLHPRLDIDVSTKRNHLLKLPFCIHPATRKLCVPVEMDQLETFNPESDPPVLDEMLASHTIDDKWMAPLRRLISTIESQPDQLEVKYKTEESLGGIKAEVKQEVAPLGPE